MVQKMKKSKGFTLIEMLVVIAIIAVLVAIIVPTVTSSTGKAKAATDAANLRSAKAAITIGVLDGSITGTSVSADEVGVPAAGKYDEGSFSAVITKGSANDTGAEIKVYYGDHAIAYYADIAAGTAEDAADTSDDKTAAVDPDENQNEGENTENQ